MAQLCIYLPCLAELGLSTTLSIRQIIVSQVTNQVYLVLICLNFFSQPRMAFLDFISIYQPLHFILKLLARSSIFYYTHRDPIFIMSICCDYWRLFLSKGSLIIRSYLNIRSFQADEVILAKIEDEANKDSVYFLPEKFTELLGPRYHQDPYASSFIFLPSLPSFKQHLSTLKTRRAFVQPLFIFIKSSFTLFYTAKLRRLSIIVQYDTKQTFTFRGFK